MLITILATVIALVSWSLHLMQESAKQREFSLMLAGTLVAFSAAALMGVYFLAFNCIGYFSNMSHQTPYEFSVVDKVDSDRWSVVSEILIADR